MKNLLLLLCLSLMTIWTACSPQDKPADDAAATATNSDTTKAMPAAQEIGDAKYADMLKKQMASFAAKDLNAYMANFADNAVYYWNNGDSLAGKPAIQEYWGKRFNDVVESVTFSNSIYIPVKINTPQSVELPGNYVLAWYSVDAKYKNGKSMTQWMHSVNHFNANDQIDQVNLFRDNQLINDALKK